LRFLAEAKVPAMILLASARLIARMATRFLSLVIGDFRIQ